MHKAIKKLVQYDNTNMILVDGREFKPLTYMDNKEETIKEINCVCIEGGDNKYSSIAAASIIAKVERDNYIYDLCEKHSKLDEYYQLSTNKGYGTAKHLDGIRQFGISCWHRKSFGLCKESKLITID